MLLVCLALLMACGESQKESQQHADGHDPAQAEASDTKGQPAEEYDCAKCGMPTQEFPQTASRAINQGKAVHFCCNKCLFGYLIKDQPEGFNPESLVVKDYYSQEEISGEEAIYVVGSDVSGPMGAEFVAHKTVEDAETFTQEHKGQRMAKMKDFDEDFIKMGMGK